MPAEALAVAWGSERYLARNVLGQGGMGTVYRAFDLERREEVALKRLRLRADPEANRRRLLAFEREYQALAQLHHPSIVAAHDYGVDRLGAYYTMELLSGASLHEHAERGTADWPALCAWLRDIASALAMLHARRLVHRDVTPRNIHCARGGRAKLIDFGALSNTDRIATIIGTPPFLPPEAIAGRPLDARSDLYALGATAYWALTGRHAYAAKHIAELEQLWHTPPPPPHALMESLPNALSELVMSLLSLDRGGRPSAADEVIERLTAIAGLPHEDARSVGSSYLVRPGYVGRNAQLREARRRALQALRGRGSVLIAAGMPGSGRTRFLEECALEAKLLGMSVHKLSPEDATDVARAASSIVAHARAGSSAALWMLDALEDEHADALARALAAAGLHQERALVAIAKTAPVSASKSGTQAIEVDLPPLNVLQARTLLASMFGTGAGLESLAAMLHGLSRGNVRVLIELARALVASGTLRCEAGTWLFPEHIDAAEIAELARIALGDEATRLRAMTPEIVEAAYALALSTRGLSPDALGRAVPALQRMPRAALCAQLAPVGVELRPGKRGDTFQLTDEAWSKLLATTVPPGCAARMHKLLGDIAAKSGRRVQATVHYYKAGDLQRASDLIVERAEPLVRCEPERSNEPVSNVFRRAIVDCARSAEKNGRTLRDQAILASDAFIEDIAGEFVTRGELERVIARLAHDSGLAEFARLDRALPAAERLRIAVDNARKRRAAAPPEGDESAVLDPDEATNLFGRVALAVSTIAVASLDTDWMLFIPPLDELAPLTPLFGLLDEVIRATRDCLRGRYLRARELYGSILERLARPDRGGIAGAGHHYTRLGVIHGIGFIEGQIGMPSALGHIAELLKDVHISVSAWHLQGTYYFMQGDTDQANACRERAELLNATSGAPSFYPGTSLVAELLACGLADDLIGIKRAADRLTSLADRYDGWKPLLVAAQIEYARVRGDLAAAAELIKSLPHRRLWEQGRPGSEILAIAVARALLACDRLDEAREIATELYDSAAEHGMLILPFGTTLALVEARRGDMKAAIERTEAMIEAAERLGCKGLPLGRAHETRATLACLSGDVEQLRASARACAEEYARGHNPALHALYQGLLARARRAGYPIDLELSVVHNDTRATPEAIEAELNESTCEHELAERALSHVVARSGARDGFLYLRDFRGSGEVRRLAARGAPSPLIDAHAVQVLSSGSEEVTVSVADDDGLASAALGYEHETLVLGRDEIAPTAVGVIVLVDSHRHGAPATLELLPALTRSCARRPFTGTCKHETAVLLEDRARERSILAKGAV